MRALMWFTGGNQLEAIIQCHWKNFYFLICGISTWNRFLFAPVRAKLTAIDSSSHFLASKSFFSSLIVKYVYFLPKRKSAIRRQYDKKIKAPTAKNKKDPEIQLTSPMLLNNIRLIHTLTSILIC